MKVYILLTNTGTIFTNLIKLYTKQPYNHASICFDSELKEVYSFGRKRARNPFIGGFVREDVKNGLFKQADCAIYSFTVTEVQYHAMKQYIEQMEGKKEDYRYNLVGLIGFLMDEPIQRKRAYFCSQFVATVLHDCHIMYFDKPTVLIAPNDFQKLAPFQLVYEGKLHTYPNIRIANEIDIPIGNFINIS